MDHHRQKRASEADDKVARDAIFLFISARTMATIEFPQQELIHDGKTSKPSTCIAANFFMPSLSALKWLADLEN